MSTQRTLVLLRHAKSGYPPGIADHDRPLAERGIREAALAGVWIRNRLPSIDQVLCSTAVRTRQTYELTALTAPVSYRDALYDAVPGTVIETINAVADNVKTLLVVGHEPAISSVAIGLSGAPGTDATLIRRVAEKYPTSGIAVLTVPGSWADVEPGSAALVDFHVPR